MTVSCEYQRCKNCGKEWPRYRTDVWHGGLFSVLRLMPSIYLHYRILCPNKRAK